MSNQEAPAPARSTPLHDVRESGPCLIDKKGTTYVSNIGNSTVVEFARGSLTPLKRQISIGLDEPNGVAYYPALLP
jgi:hypothetical protein